jgi:hypothetical protein
MGSLLIYKVKQSVQKEGLLSTSLKVLRHPLKYVSVLLFRKKVLQANSNEDRFTWIYKSNHWSSSESASGTGSTLSYTQNLRKELPKLLSTYSIKTIFDAPCGDFNWMKHMLSSVDVDYIGGDIVKPLIDKLSDAHGAEHVKFRHIDLTKDELPSADLMICRDCLFHLSYADIRSVLLNFVNSGIPYLLTTTHTNESQSFKNRDILTGDYRLIDLFSSPFNLPDAPLYRIDDWLHPDPERQMCLWSREQVSYALTQMK